MATLRVVAVPEFGALENAVRGLQNRPVKIPVDTAPIKEFAAIADNAIKQVTVQVGNVTKQISTYNIEIGKTLEITRQYNAETEKWEETQRRIINDTQAVLREQKRVAAEKEREEKAAAKAAAAQEKAAAKAAAAQEKAAAKAAAAQEEAALKKQQAEEQAALKSRQAWEKSYNQMEAYAREHSAAAKENAYLTRNLSGKSAAESAAVFGIPPETETNINRVLDDQGNVIRMTETIREGTNSITNEYGRNGGLISVTRRYEDEMGNAVTETQQLQNTTHLLGDSLGRIVLKMAAWQLLGNAIASVRRAFSDAIKTMKEVDDQLIIVQKTSNATAAELKDIEDQAYESAKAYGTAVDAYLETVSAFSRAGYRDNVTELADLATKTQIVGDMTAETANQFLLSVDKAYDYKGSVEALNEVLDGADYINNNYATSLEKLAEGLGIVAPVARQANVGVDELTAAIGTITAVTQRSGSESARALRALFLNIVGDTKTEIDEGVTWTTGQIAGLQDVLRKYSADAVAAAEATHSVIDPMEAIGGLAQALKDGSLYADDLFQMVSDIGGKLRASQLLALVQNWDMYESMLADYKNAAGTADREVELAMNSWSRKQQQLKNEWADFMRQMVDTDAIKGALDGIIWLVQQLNSDVGRAIATAGAITGTIWAIIAVVKALEKAIAALNTTAALGPLGYLFLGAAAVGIAVAAIDSVTTSLDEQRKVVDDLNSEYEKQFGAGSEYETLKNKVDDLTESEKSRLSVLESERRAMERLLETESEREYSKFVDAGKAKTYFTDTTGSYVGLGRDEYLYRQFLFDKGEAAAYQDTAAMDAVIAEYKDAYEERKRYQEQGHELSYANEQFIIQYEALAKSANELKKQEEELATATENLGNSVNTTADKFGVAKSVIAGTAEAYKVLDKAQKEVDDQGVISIDTLNTILDKYPELTQYLELTADGYVLTKGALEEYIASERAQYEMALNNAMSAAQTVVDAEALKKAGIDSTTMSIKQQLQAMAALYQAAYDVKVAELGGDVIARQMMGGTAEARQLNAVYAALHGILNAESDINTFNAVARTLSIGGTSSGTIGGQRAAAKSSSSSSKSAESERLKELKKAAQQAKKDAKEARDAEIKEIQEQIDALKERNKEEKEALELEKKKEDVLKKQNALLAAQQDRSTRVYNKKTGQWEWTADASKVQKAQEALKTAQESLAEYKRNKAIEEEIEALEKRKKSIKEYYDEVEKSIDDTLDGLEESTTDLTDAFNELGIAVNEYALAEQQKLESEEAAEEAQSGAGAGSESKGLKPIDGTYTVDPSTGKYLFNSFRRKDDTPDKVVKNGREYPAEDFPDLFDLGGILHGMGGIKATTRDEIVIPPSIAEKMLSPVADQAFAQRMSELNFVYGNGRTPDALMRSGGVGSVVNNSGTTYNLGGVTLTEQQAKTTSVYELAQLAQGLRCYS